jgi:hypothetical protein
MYRTSKCLEEKCRRGECPNYHSERERRVIEREISNRYFRYVPRNRIVNGTFKAELDDGFIPSNEIKVHSMIGGRNSNMTLSKGVENIVNFATKTVVGKKNREEGGGTRFFCERELVESENEN